MSSFVMSLSAPTLLIAVAIFSKDIDGKAVYTDEFPVLDEVDLRHAGVLNPLVVNQIVYKCGVRIRGHVDVPVLVGLKGYGVELFH